MLRRRVLPKFTCALLCLLAVLCTFASCSLPYIPIKKNVDLLKADSKIQHIDIYYLEDAYYEGNISELRSKMTPVYTLTTEQQSAFVEELHALKFQTGIPLIIMPMDGGYIYEGYVISVVYADDSYDLIAKEGQYSYHNIRDGSHDYDYANYCGNRDWDEWIESYIGSETPSATPDS